MLHEKGDFVQVFEKWGHALYPLGSYVHHSTYTLLEGYVSASIHNTMWDVSHNYPKV